MIRFDGFNNAGKLRLIENSIDPHKYPGDFDAKYQDFEYRNNEYLHIEGTHLKEQIGQYMVDITPLKE